MAELESTAAGTPDLDRAEMARGRSRVSHSQKKHEKIIEMLHCMFVRPSVFTALLLGRFASIKNTLQHLATHTHPRLIVIKVMLLGYCGSASTTFATMHATMLHAQSSAV